MTSVDTAEREIDAIEYVLALDGRDDRRRFEAELLDDPGLAAAVWTAEEQLRPLAEAIANRPVRGRVWQGIEARAFGRERKAQQRAQRAASFWRSLAQTFGVAAFASTAVLLVVLARPDLVSVPQPQWVAGIVRPDGTIALARVREDGRLVAQPFPVDDVGSAELWLVTASAAPVSVALLATTAPTDIDLAPDVARRLEQGATLVITLEPAGGSPTGQPTGPRLGAGSLAQI